MVDEFDLPMSIIDRKVRSVKNGVQPGIPHHLTFSTHIRVFVQWQVRKMKLISPTNREVDIGQTLLPNEYIGMTRREVLDTYLRDRAISMGTLRVCRSRC